MPSAQKVIFLCPYPIGCSPSQRFRFEQYFEILKGAGFQVSVSPFLSVAGWRVLYQPGNYFIKVVAIVRGFLLRWLQLFALPLYEWVFIHREAAPLGPPVFEWIISHLLRKKIIYDFDDAIWLPNTSKENNFISKLKWHSKVGSICKWSYSVSCGNEYLCDFARKFNAHAILNPTTIDTTGLHNPALYSQKPKSDWLTIGWTGTHSTLKYIDSILPVIQSLEKKFTGQLMFMVIADKRPAFELKCLSFITWSKEAEIQDLIQFDIGIMPLENDPWAKGKCGFKALQYLALGIPALVSPVGVNTSIVDHGVNGFLCSTTMEWEQHLQQLIENANLRKRMGRNGRVKVQHHFSVESNAANFLSLFE